MSEIKVMNNISDTVLINKKQLQYKHRDELPPVQKLRFLVFLAAEDQWMLGRQIRCLVAISSKLLHTC